MGVAQIMLDDLNLSNIVIGWYKLFGTTSLVSKVNFFFLFYQCWMLVYVQNTTVIGIDSNSDHHGLVHEKHVCVSEAYRVLLILIISDIFSFINISY